MLCVLQSTVTRARSRSLGARLANCARKTSSSLLLVLVDAISAQETTPLMPAGQSAMSVCSQLPFCIHSMSCVISILLAVLFRVVI